MSNVLSFPATKTEAVMPLEYRPIPVDNITLFRSPVKQRTRIRPDEDRQEYALRNKKAEKSSDTFKNAAEVSSMVSSFLKAERWRDALLLVTGCNTKFRASDVVAIKWKDILDENLSVKKQWDFTEIKTGKIVSVTSNEAFTRMVELYLRKTGAPEGLNNYVFQSSSNRKNHYFKIKDKCNDRAMAESMIADIIQKYDSRGIGMSSRHDTSSEIVVEFSDSSTVEWGTFQKEGDLYVFERMYSDVPLGLTVQSVEKIIRNEAIKLGIHDQKMHRISSHSMRKAAENAAQGLFDDRPVPKNLYNQAMPIEAVSRWMGHKSSKTTMTYYANEKELYRNIFMFINLGIEAINEFELNEARNIVFAK